MEQKAILLNGGRDLDVTLVPGADEFLAKLLGAAPSKPTVPSLKLVDNAPGHRSVGVFIGTRQIGFLDQQDDQELIATLRACQLNGAAARVRGSLLTSVDDPSKVTVKVDLSESDKLLGDPTADRPATPAVETPEPDRSAFEPASPASSVSPVTMADSPPPASPEDSTAPELSSGQMEDYPDWPPRKPTPTESTWTEKPGAVSQLASDPTPTPETMPAPEATPAREATAVPDTTPAPETTPQSSTPPDTLLSTRSAWMGATPMPGGESQPGWLGSSGSAGKSARPGQDETSSDMTQHLKTGQTGWLGMSEQAPQTAGPRVTALEEGSSLAGVSASTSQGMGTGTAAMGTGAAHPNLTSTPSAENNVSWQDYAERAAASGGAASGEGASSGETSSGPPTTGWTPGDPGASATRPSSEVRPAGMSSNAKAWIAGVLVVAVLAGAGFALWKTFWASKTYKDPEYGYSFSYPGGWDKMDLTSEIASAALVATEDIPPMDAVAVGDIGDSMYMPEEFSVAVVGMFDTGVIVDDARISAVMQETQWELAQMPNLGYGMSIAVIEPPTQATVAGLNGYTMTISMDAGGMSMLATYCFLFDGSVMYLLGGMCDGDAWAKFQKTFDSLVSSFKPGHTRF